MKPEMKIRFNNDYSEGAHSEIMARLNETNMIQTAGYGEDPFCDSARDAIKRQFGCQQADVHFLVGGTQANLTVIAAALRPHQAVICAETGHINVHETGAIESCGHKVIGLPHSEGTITAEQIDAYVKAHYNDETHEHITQPKLVYISQPTELGTIYSKDALTAIYQICQKHGLYLFIDGARLGYGLSSADNDLDDKTFSALSDVFTIGGTKMGALFGEAVVINHPALKQDFRYIMKQKGAMLAKGRLLGIQFLSFFEKDLYRRLGNHADALAMQLKTAMLAKGYTPYVNSPTNQQFFILPDADLLEIEKYFTYAYIERIDATHSAVRFCTSWATRPEDVKTLIKFIDALH
ncbi:MAG: threonine aldolase [Clostridiales bacterium]|nr:threonine aldolase [Clostridiales bacterium]MDN5298465.1 threonine aldolase [Clostridiales bacterium]